MARRQKNTNAFLIRSDFYQLFFATYSSMISNRCLLCSFVCLFFLVVNTGCTRQSVVHTALPSERCPYIIDAQASLCVLEEAEHDMIIAMEAQQMLSLLHKKAVNPDIERLVQLALSQLGTPYRRGGMSPKRGFDCSGFTVWVYNALGITLPRTSYMQFTVGKAIPKAELETGDLVFFRKTPKRISHVGIYLSDGNFIHSNVPGGSVRITNLKAPIWKKQWAGARRYIE